MKIYLILPIVAIFLIAISVGKPLRSLSYLLTSIPALILLFLSAILIVKELRKKNQTKE